MTHTVEEKRIQQIARYGVKLPLLKIVWAGQGWILPYVKWLNLFLGPWLIVCQFIDISNQIEPTGEVANILHKNI